ncbi:3-hydroxyacyl-CoA dehydrogenase NAD-binding domain-containing protein [Rhodovulum sp. PH10]|uniref:3-hydroxyacyl-CoA dehydrogenase NAD-binding domain-containing protein n=1 Tax=Rhodovulum sp. PH10 TaxID=1187851 RepID=UPI00058EE0FE|nr:3-hydroxyacyl-CoA dehydrogenase NAD-binding domain-containing protein [Rhodovulum sp. PH10]
MKNWPDYQKIAIVGAGTIGGSWAALFLAKGYDVTVFDPAPGADAAVKTLIEGAWPALRQLAGAPETPQWASLHFVDEVAEAVANADFVQESGPEKPEFKQTLFAQMEAAMPAETIIASSTSGLTLEQLRSGAKHPGRILVGHPFNPPHLVPLVEVVGDEKTDPAAIETAMAFYQHLGKVPVRLTRSVIGHLANRLQGAVWREALYLVSQGIASARDVDAAVAFGPGLRWAIMGPTTTFHLGGGPGGVGAFIDKLGPAVQTWWDDLGTLEWTPELIERLKTEMAELPDYQTLRAERDEKLVEIIKLVK